MSDSSDSASDDSDQAPANRRVLSESEDENRPELPAVSRNEFAYFKRILSPSDDEAGDDDEKHDEGGEELLIAEEETKEVKEGDRAASKDIGAALKALRKVFPMSRPAEAGGSSAALAGPSAGGSSKGPETDEALKAVLRLRKKGTKGQKRMMDSVDWEAVKTAAVTDPPYAEYPVVLKAMKKLRAALPQPHVTAQPAPPASDIFSHRAGMVRAALRKAWELDTAIDLLEPQTKPEKERVRVKKAKDPALTTSATDSGALPSVARSRGRKRNASELLVISSPNGQFSPDVQVHLLTCSRTSQPHFATMIAERTREQHNS